MTMLFETASGDRRRTFSRLAALMISTALAAGAFGVSALAQQSESPQAGQGRPSRGFDIPPQSLTEGLTAFGRQSGWQVSVHGDLIQGVSTPGVSGTMSPEQALGRLLAGTGFSYSLSDGNTVTLQKLPSTSGAIPLDPVSVEGRDGAGETAWGPVPGYVAKRSAGATKTDTPIIETPQSISVITAEQIADRKAETVEDAVAYTAGVRVGSSGFDPRFDQISIRGFEVTSTADYLDGLRQPNTTWLSYYGTEPYDLERVEVVKGPASVLYGQISPGGLVNRVSKRPGEEALREVELQAGNNDRYQGQFDLGGKASQDGEILYRLVGVARDAGTDIEWIDDDTRFLAPSVTWRPSAETHLTVLTQYQYKRTAGSPRPYQSGSQLTKFWSGDEHFDKLEQTQYTAGYEFEHAFDDRLTFRQNARYGNVDTVNQYTASSDSGDGHTLNRTAYGVYEAMQSVALDNQLQMRFATGPVRHTLLAGQDYMWQDSHVLYAWGAAPSIDILAPDHDQFIARPANVAANQNIGANLVGLYAQDQLEVGHWRLTGGVRHDWADATTRDNLEHLEVSQNDGATTGRAGLLYLTDSGFAPFASYATSFMPEFGLDANGRAFKPTEGKQYEAGVKYQPPGSNSLVTAALYHLTKSNVKTTDPVDPLNSVQTGEQRSRGLELEGVADLRTGLKLLGSYTFTDAKVTKSNDVDLGKRPVTVPRHMASLWADYTPSSGTLAGLGGGAGVRWVGSSYDDLANTRKNDPYTQLDAVIHYDLAGTATGTRLALNVGNLTDERYVTCESGYCYRGQGRTVIGSIRYRW
ncbi:TonB-dependent siderophore receptor [Telmatospirillum siberiense]|uniref:TonB-dependent siderophore receptor n=1 Tax=Telmatospirillum siberiense TaxID=382514 RepID=A0A2N3Q0G0_9PROT|nr:TonB-dependent siderophore receptor [Telmatospirillum siberiense]PKU26134.1 TonB-dependent siderophore receptor [Telmatospirillum siberiense]